MNARFSYPVRRWGMVGFALLLAALVAFSPLVAPSAVHDDLQVHFMDDLADGDHEPGVG